ncbi:MAG: ATP-binding cassette domain-containing protein [Bdellovibrionales bacterium]|nr:ATP-binding cassette domain-containing protein [Bdellovibrionales bacterium]
MAELIRFHQVTVGYPKRVFLKDLDLTIHSGEIIAIVGPNGTGKTSLLRTLLGLGPILSGKLEVMTDVKKRSAYLPQKLKLNPEIPLTTREFLGLLGSDRQSLAPAVPSELSFGLLEQLGGSREWLDQSIHSLSGGELQRVVLAFTFQRSPRFAALDEAVEGLDLKSQQTFYRWLKSYCAKEDASVVLVSHDISAVTEWASRVICLGPDLVFDGDPKSKDFHTCLHDIYGEGSHIHDHRHSH